MGYNSKYKGAEVDALLDKAGTAVQPSSLATVATSGSYTDLFNTPTIPDELADLADDSTHRVVTDTQISTWNGKQDDVCLSVVDGKVCITYTV